MGISVVLLAYKEEENLKVLLPQIIDNVKKTGEEYEILVIDTEKPLDNTKGVCEQYGAKYINQEYPAFAGAFKTGIKYASMDKFLILDSDGSHDPSRIPAIHEKFVNENCDVCIGSRYTEGGVTNDVGSSIVMSKILNTTFRILLGIKAKDISTDYRMYRTEQLKKVNLTCRNYDVLQEVLLKLRLNKKDLKIGEVPINFQKRMFGESKRRLLPFIMSYIKTMFKLGYIRFKDIILYGLFGICGFVIDYAIVNILNAAGVFGKGVGIFSALQIATLCGGVCGFIFTFFTNTYLNFKKSDKFAKRFALYAFAVIVGMAIRVGFTQLLEGAMPAWLLSGLLLVIVTVLQFIFNKFVTYKD